MPIRAINESFMVLLIGSLINFGHISLWTFSETVNSSIVFIVLGIIVLFPLWLMRLLNRNIDRL